MEEEKEQKDEQKNNPEDKVYVSNPKVMFDGQCDHDFNNGVDDEDEGIIHIQCKKCPYGVRVEKGKYKVVKGKLEEV